jgi:hypothetical protein
MVTTVLNRREAESFNTRRKKRANLPDTARASDQISRAVELIHQRVRFSQPRPLTGIEKDISLPEFNLIGTAIGD